MTARESIKPLLQRVPFSPSRAEAAAGHIKRLGQEVHRAGETHLHRGQ